MKLIGKTVLFSLGAAMLIGITGCSSKEEVKPEEPVAECVVEGAKAPEWVCGSSDVPGYYTSVGGAPFSKLGLSFSRREALANGRSNLAQQIESEVKDKVATFAQSTGVGDNEVADKVSTQVSKQVAKVTLKGSKQIKYWQAPSKEIYLLVAVPQSTVNQEVKSQVASSYKNDNALWQQFQAKNAMDELDKEFPTE